MRLKKLNVQNSVVFLFTNHEQETIFLNPNYNCIKNNKASRFKSKEIKDLNLEKCKTLIKEIENNTNKHHTHSSEELMCYNDHTTQENLQIQYNPY